MATCVLTHMPQSFAVHVTGPPALSTDVAAYLKPAQYLDWIGRCTMSTDYAANYAIAEQTEASGVTVWWLVFSCTRPRDLNHVQRWLDSHMATAARLAVRMDTTPVGLVLSKVEQLSPLLQRKLLWGDARTTPAMLDSFNAELAALGWTETMGHMCKVDDDGRVTLARHSDRDVLRMELLSQEVLLRGLNPVATQDADFTPPVSNVPGLPAASSTELQVIAGEHTVPDMGIDVAKGSSLAMMVRELDPLPPPLSTSRR